MNIFLKMVHFLIYSTVHKYGFIVGLQITPLCHSVSRSVPIFLKLGLYIKMLCMFESSV